MDSTKVIELQSFGILPDTEDDYTEKLNNFSAKIRKIPYSALKRAFTVFITVPPHGVSMQ